MVARILTMVPRDWDNQSHKLVKKREKGSRISNDLFMLFCVRHTIVTEVCLVSPVGIIFTRSVFFFFFFFLLSSWLVSVVGLIV